MTDRGNSAAGEPTDTETGTTEGTGERASFGRLTPREAGLRSAQARREQAAQRLSDPDVPVGNRVLVVRSTVHVAEIIRRLNRDAKAGSVSAARELRAWLNEVVREDSTDVSDLDRRTTQEIMARLLAELEAEGFNGPPSQEGSRDAREEGGSTAEGGDPHEAS